MNLIRKIAKPCGILGGIWGIAVSLLGLLLMPAATVTAAILIFIFLLGALSIWGTLFSQRRFRLAVILLWASGIAYLPVGIITGPWIFLPASLLLIIAAIGLQ